MKIVTDLRDGKIPLLNCCSRTCSAKSSTDHVQEMAERTLVQKKTSWKRASDNLNIKEKAEFKGKQNWCQKAKLQNVKSFLVRGINLARPRLDAGARLRSRVTRAQGKESWCRGSGSSGGQLNQAQTLPVRRSESAGEPTSGPGWAGVTVTPSSTTLNAA